MNETTDFTSDLIFLLFKPNHSDTNSERKEEEEVEAEKRGDRIFLFWASLEREKRAESGHDHGGRTHSKALAFDVSSVATGRDIENGKL